jgi:hypothetical protein
VVSAPSIRWIGCHAQNFARLRGGVHPEAVVLHIAAGSLAGMDSWFGNPAAGVSAHFGVGKDGRVHQYVSLDDTAFANGIVEQGHTARLIDDNPGINPNAWSCSIEHEGFTGDTLTSEQWDASTRLTAWLFAAHLLAGGASGVAVDRDHILRHADITARTRARCPGWPGRITPTTSRASGTSLPLIRTAPASCWTPSPSRPQRWTRLHSAPSTRRCAAACRRPISGRS